MDSIISHLEAAVEAHPDNILFSFLNASGEIVDAYTYRLFHERTNYVSASLRDAGAIRYGQPVLLVYPPGLDFIVAFFACVKSGAIPVPVPPPDSSGFVGGLEKLAGFVADCGAATALTTRHHLEHMRDVAGRSAESTQAFFEGPLGRLAWVATDGLQGALADYPSRVSSLLLLQYTSGATQSPRGVMVSHGNVIHNCFATVDHRPVGVSWLPHYHDMGLIGCHLYILLRRGCLYGFSGANFLKRPLLWLETISRFRGTISGAPNFAFEYCLRDDRVPPRKLESLDLRSMRCLMNASEPVRASTYERFLAKFERCGLSPQASVVFYGLAENTLSVSGDGRVRVTVNTHLLEQNRLRLEAARTDAYDQTRLVSCGRPRPGVEVRIVDGATRTALGEDRIGEVWVAGEGKARGYWNKPALTRELLEATIEDETDGARYLRTGDRGFLHEGELFICGRLKDMIIIGGRNYYPNDIEAVVEHASPKVRPGCVAAFAIHREDGEALAVLAEATRANDPPDLEQIVAAVRKRCQIEIDVLALVPHGSMVKTSSAKIARQEIRRRWQQGLTHPVTQRNRTATETTADSIDELLRRLAATEQDEVTLAELGLDSMTLVELSLYLERLAETLGPEARELHDTLFDLRLLQAVTVGELRAFLSRPASPSEAPAIDPRTYIERLRSIESEELALMQRDARLPLEIAPNGFHGAPGNKVLLTGATGFLGSFVLESLLRKTDLEVVTLVRAEDAAHARRRTESALERTGLWDDRLQQAFASRVTALQGDIAQPMFGQSARRWDALCREVSGIYYCGAEVDYVKPYRALFGPNVSSTIEVLRLATTACRKALHYASTTFVFGFGGQAVCREDDWNAEMAGLNFGYTQTKWVAEQLVHEAVQRGVAARVYRPAFITASGLGRYVRRDLTVRVLAYMIQHRIAVDSANQISFLPVDVCASNIVALSLLDDPQARSFHLTADDYYTLQTVCGLITRHHGYSFDYMSIERMVAHVNEHCTKEDPLFPLVAFFNHNFRRIDEMRDKRYLNDIYRRSRALSALSMDEPPLAETVSSIVTFLQREHLVPSAPLQEERRAG